MRIQCIVLAFTVPNCRVLHCPALFREIFYLATFGAIIQPLHMERGKNLLSCTLRYQYLFVFGRNGLSLDQIGTLGYKLVKFGTWFGTCW